MCVRLWLVLAGLVIFGGWAVRPEAQADLAGASNNPWSPNERLYDGQGGCNQESPDVAVDGDGNVYAVWVECRNGESDIYFSYRPVHGTWNTSTKISDDELYCGEDPSIAVDDAGNAFVVWTRGCGSDKVYFDYRPAGGTWGASVRITDGWSPYETNPSIAVDEAGNAYAIWFDHSHRIYFSYRPVGGVWSPRERVNDSFGTPSWEAPAIAVDAAGNAYAVWVDRRGGGYHENIYFSFRPAGGDWEPDVRVNNGIDSLHPEDPKIAVDGAGNAYIVFIDENRRDVYFSYRLAGGDWGSTIEVNDGGSPRNTLGLAVDADGSAIAVWEDYRNDPNGGCDGDTCDADVYFSYRPVGGSWSANARVNNDIGNRIQDAPSIAMDHAGNAYVVWADRRNGDADVYSSDWSVGSDWAVNTQVNEDDEGTAENSFLGLVAVTVDGAGDAYAIWIDERDGDSDVYLSHRSAGGTWGSNLQINKRDAAAWQWYPSIAANWAGDVYAMWVDYRLDNGAFQLVYAQQPSSGTWNPSVEIADAYGENPSLAVDPDGNAYAVWRAYVGDEDIYFGYRPAGGRWDVNDRVNDDTGTADQWSPAIAVDEAGNASSVWADDRNGNSDIYFSYRPVGGRWSSNVKVNDDIGTAAQGSPAIAVDEAGNAYAAWWDDRNGDGDIYFSYRPLGGEWSASIRVNDDTGTAAQYQPDIAVDGAGHVFAVWLDERGGLIHPYASLADFSPLLTGRSEVFLPVLLRGERTFGRCDAGFEAGRFERCWDHGGELAQRVVNRLDTGEPAYAGRYSALLGQPELGSGIEGDIPAGSAWIQQRIQVPDTARPRLTFWYRVISYDASVGGDGRLWDTFDAFIGEELVFRDDRGEARPPGSQGGRHDTGWQRGDVDLSRWRGQEVVLRFAAWNREYDGNGMDYYNTWAYLDDVQVEP